MNALSTDWAFLSSIAYSSQPMYDFQAALKMGISAEDFVSEEAAAVFEVYSKAALSGASTLPTIPEIAHEFERRPPIKKGFSFDRQLKNILETRRRRVLAKLLEDATKFISSDDIDGAYSMMANVTEMMETQRRTQGVPVDTRRREWASEYAHRINQEVEKVSKGQLLGMQTPYAELDKISGGLRKDNFWIIASPTKGGKTFFMMNWLHYVELHSDPNDCFLFISPETGRGEIEDRYTSLHQQINASELSLRQIPISRARELSQWADDENHHRKTIFLYPAQCRSLKDVIRYTKMYKPKMVFLDSFYLLDIGLTDEDGKPFKIQKNHDRIVKLAELINIELAQKCGVPVLGTYQIKTHMDRFTLQIQPGDLGGATGVATSCTALLALLGDQQMHDSGERLFQVVISRSFAANQFIKLNFKPDEYDFTSQGLVEPPEQRRFSSKDQQGGVSTKKRERRG